MNQGRIWCVVKPTVGLPLFLGSVAVTSLVVHYSVLSNTTWFAAFLNGKGKPKVASAETAAPPVAVNSSNGAQGFVISVAPVEGKTADAPTSYVITLTPQPAATAQAGAPADSASASPPKSLALAAPNAK